MEKLITDPRTGKCGINIDYWVENNVKMPGISEDIKFNSIKKELKYLQARAQTQERNDWGFSVLHSHDWKKSMGVYQGLVTYG